MSRVRLTRSQIAVGAAAPTRVRLTRAAISAEAVTNNRVRILRAEVAVVQDVTVPGAVQADSFRLVSLTATVPGTVTAWSWRQTAGTALTLFGSTTNIVSFSGPPKVDPADYTLEVRALTSAGWTAWRASTVTVAAHPWWKRVNGVLVPLATEPDREQIVEVPPVGSSGSTETPPVVVPPVVEPPPVVVPGQTADTGLFFKRPTNFRGYARKSFGHFFPPYPISFDNKVPTADSYVNTYLNVNGIAAQVAEAGLLRDRPIPTQPKGTDYLVQNARQEIQWAMDGGHDGFLVDMLGDAGNTARMAALRTAAATYYPGLFYVIPMIDANSAAYGNASVTDPNTPANFIKLFKGQPFSYYLPDGRYVIGNFKVEGRTEAWWQSVRTAVGGPTAWLGVFLNYTGQGANYSTLLADAIAGSWGYGGDPIPISRAGSQATLAHSRGQKWIEGLNSQNNRPNQHWWEECGGTEAWRQSHLLALRGGAEYTQDVTWSDFSENGQTMPSVQNGHVLNDLGCYWKAWWKTGAPPAILRDALYVSHRNQFTTATPQFTSTAPMTQRRDRNGVTEPLNIVEVRSFLTAPAEITISMGAATPVVYTAPAGEFRATAPLALGTANVVARRSGVSVHSITTNVPVTASPVVQDLNYYRWSSLRPLDTYLTPLSHL